MKLTAKILLPLFFLILAFGIADANDAAERELTPRITAFAFRQVGATDLHFDVRGTDLPLPDVTSLVNRTYIRFRSTSGARAQFHEEQGRGINPLITSVNARQNGDDFVITLVTELPISPNSVRGVPPAEAFILIFNTTEHRQRLIDTPGAIARPQTLRVPTGPFASNAPITLDLRETFLPDVFRMLGQHMNMNMIIHHSVPMVNVTMTFRDAPLSTVFGFLMRDHNITYEFIDQNTVVIGTANGLSRTSGREVTESFRIAYAEPSAVMANVLRMTRVQAEDVVLDDRLRTIFVTGTPDILEEVAIAVQALDNPGRQVMIHARILEFNQDQEMDVAQALNALYDRWHFSFTQGGRLTVNYDFMRSAGGTMPLRPGSPPNTTGMGIFGTPRYVRRVTDGAFTALETRLNARTLANPSVITIDGVQANIDLTQDIPYVSGVSDGQMTWSSISIGPRLTFTPIIGRDGTVTLNLDLQASERGIDVPTQFGLMPTANQRNVTTTVRVRNGEPFVVGGLYRTTESRSILRIPILGHLPILGELFTQRSSTSDTTQVIMVVIPYILDTPDVGVEQARVMQRQRW